ncbi:FRIGIDA-like protein 4a [Manihot esculenta]|uniref:FRIGIDA-like protein 4a n=1 Tax=Manihot esculenta TaxID=3983 RepID=UPI000B5D6942|nr:FRIGIDA-like protein 4a [Manihot esculenta]
MGSIPDPGELAELTFPSFDDFQRQTSLMRSCTLLWKEPFDLITSFEQNLQKKSEALKHKLQILGHDIKATLASLKKREVTIDGSVEIVLECVDEHREAALKSLENSDHPNNEVDDGDGLLQLLRSFCLKMHSREFWKFAITKKKELDVLRGQIPLALVESVCPARFALKAITKIFSRR